jgi:hypothetical protein
MMDVDLNGVFIVLVDSDRAIKMHFRSFPSNLNAIGMPEPMQLFKQLFRRAFAGSRATRLNDEHSAKELEERNSFRFFQKASCSPTPRKFSSVR